MRLLHFTFSASRLAALLCTAASLNAAFVITAHAQTPGTAVPVQPAGGAVGQGPNGATLRCQDGFLPAPNAPDSACAERGGVAARYPIKRTPSRAAAAAAALREVDSRPRAPNTQVMPDTTRPPGFESFAMRRARADSANRAVGTKPVGATLLCNDGTWVLRDTSSARCASRGGVRAVVPRDPR